MRHRIGIPPGKQSAIFQPFTQADSSTTRQYGGSGLGLAICSRLAALAGWRIGLESEPGIESTFTLFAGFDLPPETSTDAERTGARVEDPADAPLLTQRILVAEDNEFNRALLREVLLQASCDFTIVDNGAEAVELFRREHFGTVLMDLHMPVMDGFEAARRIRDLERVSAAGAVRRRAVVIAYTADDHDSRIRDGERFDAVLRKPLRKRDILEALSRLSDNAGAFRGVAPGRPKPEPFSDGQLTGPLDYEYGLNAAGGVKEQFHFLARLFLEHTPKLMSSLERAVTSGNEEEIALHAHSLEGASAAIGGMQLSSAAGRLTHAARARLDRDETGTLHNAVGSTWVSLVAVLETMVGDPAGN